MAVPVSVEDASPGDEAAPKKRAPRRKKAAAASEAAAEEEDVEVRRARSTSEGFAEPPCLGCITEAVRRSGINKMRPTTSLTHLCHRACCACDVRYQHMWHCEVVLSHVSCLAG